VIDELHATPLTPFFHQQLNSILITNYLLCVATLQSIHLRLNLGDCQPVLLLQPQNLLLSSCLNTFDLVLFALAKLNEPLSSLERSDADLSESFLRAAVLLERDLLACYRSVIRSLATSNLSFDPANRFSIFELFTFWFSSRFLTDLSF
jgi:hypothetical protein